MSTMIAFLIPESTFALPFPYAEVRTMTMEWKHTKDLPNDFEETLVSICLDALSTPEHPCNPVDLLGCWMSESELYHFEINRGSWATGIFQLMPTTAYGLGWRKGDKRWDVVKSAQEKGDWLTVSRVHESIMREFAQLTATEQLWWARKYYGAHKGMLTSAAACYVATFHPADLSHASNPDFVICAAPSKHISYPSGRDPSAYYGNFQAFDKTKKGWIEVRDLANRINEVMKGPRWEEIKLRVLGAEQAHVMVSSA